MSFSGAMFSIHLCFFFAFIEKGKTAGAVYCAIVGFLFFAGALCHDGKQERRITELERKITKRGNENGRD